MFFLSPAPRIQTMSHIHETGEAKLSNEMNHWNVFGPSDVLLPTAALDFDSFENFSFLLSSEVIPFCHWWSCGPICYSLT